MSMFPCQNPSCKSFGTPHPNCRCEGGLAEGGDVSFCARSQPHKAGCQYFAEGGEADFIPDDKFVADQGPDFVSDTEFTPDPETSIAPEFVPDDEFAPDDANKYDSIPQQIGAGLEGVAQGIAGPLAPAAEIGLSKLGVPGLSAQDIAARQAANPATHALGETAGLIGSLALGTGEAALVGKAAATVADATKLADATSMAAKIGVGALKGAIETGLFQAGDNITKSILGTGDPGESFSSILSSGALGAITGGLGGAVAKGLTDIGASGGGTKLHSFLAGVGESAQGLDPAESYARYLNPQSYEAGAKWWGRKTALISAGAGLAALHDVKRGWDDDNLDEGLIDAAETIAKGAGLSYAVKKISAPAGAALLKAISNGEMSPRGLFQVMDYADKAASGAQKMSRAVESLFKVGGQQLIDKYDFEKGRSKLEDWIDNGGVDGDLMDAQHEQNSPPPGQYADGGEVAQEEEEKPSRLYPPAAIANTFPEQNLMAQMAKTRVSNYLTSLKPPVNPSKLPFDFEPDQTMAKKNYKRALDIALQPLSIMSEINSGTIEPDHVKHLNALYPEVSQALQQKITENIVKSQLKDERPTFAVRQGLSLFMGTPLSSELTPQNMSAAQGALAGQQAQQQASGAPAPKGKSGTSHLSKSDQSFLTGNQSLVKRQQRG